MYDEMQEVFHPMDMGEDNVLVFLCGVHGVGKTSRAKLLPDKFEEHQTEAYYIREMNRKPKLKAGTPEFQAWYEKRMLWRDNSIMGQLNAMYNRPEILIMDRIKQDVDVYSNFEKYNNKKYILELANDLVFELRQWAMFYEDKDDRNIHIYCILITRDVDDVMTSIKERMNEVGQEQRQGWEEDNKEKWLKLNELFKKVWMKAQLIVDSNTMFSSNIYILTHDNKNIEQSVEEIVEEVRLIW